MSRMRGLAGSNLLRRTFRHDPAAALASLRPHVDHPVSRLYDIQVVFDDDNGVACIPQALHDNKQCLDILEVQAGGWLIQDVEGVASVPLGQLTRQLDPLGFSTGQGSGVLPERHIGQADVHQGRQLTVEHGHGIEEVKRLLDRHAQHLVDVPPLVADIQCLPPVAPALAHITGYIDVGQEMHLHLDQAVTLAGLTASALDIEAEASGLVAARTRFMCAGEQVAYRREQAGIGGWIAARGAAYGALVDINDLVEYAKAADALQRRRRVSGVID